MADFWPAIILSCLNDVDFITAAWPMFMCPNDASFWIDGKALWIAMAFGKQFWCPAGLFWIIGGDTAIM